MFFDQVTQAPADPIFGLLGTFAKDPRREKISLMVGIYKDEHLKAELFSSVRKAKERIGKLDLMADYLPIDGYGPMLSLLGPIVFGEKIWGANAKRIDSAHTVGGTGALRTGAEFFVQEIGDTICIPDQTWPNHRLVFERAKCKIKTYSYYNQKKKGFDLEAMLADLNKLAPKTAVLLHACCHNPTGCDPTLAEWREISRVIKAKQLLPFFDFAYQGLGVGLEQDAAALRMFVEEGHELLVAYSCSKNFSMYCQRVGAFFAVSESEKVKAKVESQVKRIIRALYSNPPVHGAFIVEEVLKTLELREMWHKDLEKVRHRMTSVRQMLIERLSQKAENRNFDSLKKHQGMFSFIDLNKAQVQRLMDEFAIYMTDNGRISIAGLNSENIDYVVKGILAVCDDR